MVVFLINLGNDIFKAIDPQAFLTLTTTWGSLINTYSSEEPFTKKSYDVNRIVWNASLYFQLFYITSWK